MLRQGDRFKMLGCLLGGARSMPGLQGKKATQTTTHHGGTSYRESDVERGIA
jgi:hypothetical protein